MYFSSERVVDLVAKTFSQGAFMGVSGVVPAIQTSQVLSNVLQRVKIENINGKTQINAQDYQIQALMEYRSIEHKHHTVQSN